MHSLLDVIPPSSVIRRELSRNLRETDLLRRLLKLSRDIEENRLKDAQIDIARDPQPKK